MAIQEIPSRRHVPCLILARDGVINEERGRGVITPSDWTPIPGSLEAIARLNHAGYQVVVATNQPGIARGELDVETLGRIHAEMFHRLAVVGGTIDAIFFCPHGPDDGCNCRKPRPGLLLEIGDRLGIELADTMMIGDSLADVEAARAAGAQPVLVRTGRLEKGEGPRPSDVPVFRDLAAVADHLLEHGVIRGTPPA